MRLTANLQTVNLIYVTIDKSTKGGIMELGLRGKAALVTGGARGIGLTICECLAEEGVNIGVVDTLKDEADQAAELLKSKYKVESISLCSDVSNQILVNKAVNIFINKFNKIDILVNNAGIFPYAMIEELDEKDWDKTLSVNLKGVFLCAKVVIPYMKKQKQGRIINAASLVGSIPAVGESAYAASKAAIINFTMSLAAELGPFNITVNSYAPGIVLTPMSRKMIEKNSEDFIDTMPFKRFGETREVGNLIVFLASDAASYITGANIPVAGGQVISQNQWKAYEFYNM